MQLKVNCIGIIMNKKNKHNNSVAGGKPMKLKRNNYYNKKFTSVYCSYSIGNEWFELGENSIRMPSFTTLIPRNLLLLNDISSCAYWVG